MRRVEFNFLEEKGDFVDSIRSASLATFAPLTQGDTIQAAVTKLQRPADPSTSLNPLVVLPWSFSQIRLSLGYIDRAPLRGTFRLAVAGTATSLLTWPSDLTTSGVTTWKASVLAAVNAVAGSGAARLDDPAGAPVNFLYFTWTDPADTRALTVVESRLSPPIDLDEAIGILQPAPAYQQLVKLATLPLVQTTDFAFPYPPTVEIAREVAGSGSGNESQLILIPEGASGSFDLAWAGARTLPLAVDGLTASAIASALNGIVSTPSFAVAARTALTGAKFAVSFIGPLAAAAQTLLVAGVRDQAPLLTALGTLDLRRELFERALNGAASCTLSLELVVTADAGESTVLREITLLNDMTGPGSPSSIAEAGAVTVLTRTVYVETGDPFMTATPGLSFALPAVGSVFTFTHNFGSFLPMVSVHQKTQDSPETWREAKPTEFLALSTDADHTQVVFPWEFTDSATLGDGSRDPLYRGFWKVLLISPNAQVSINAHEHTWDQVKQTLPSGETAAAKFAALDAALGVFGGSLRVNAANITGLLTAAQIDASGLATALAGQATFAAALQSVFGSNAAALNSLIASLGSASAFATQLAATITANSSITSAISGALVGDSTFLTTARDIVLSILQGGGNLPEGSTLMLIPDVALVIPAPQEIAGPSITRTIPVTESSVVTEGGTQSTVSKVVSQTVTEPTIITKYAALEPAITGLTDGGTITGKLDPAGPGAAHYYTVTGSATSRSARGRRGEIFAAGDVIAFGAGHWYRGALLGGVFYSAETEQGITTLVIDTAELYPGSRFSVTLPLFLALAGNVIGRCEILAEIGSYTGDLTSVGWTQLFSAPVHLTPAARLRSFGVTVTHATGGALTGSWSLQGQATAFTPPSLPFALRFRATKFDTEDVPDPRGSFSIRLKSAAASIVPQ